MVQRVTQARRDSHPSPWAPPEWPVPLLPREAACSLALAALCLLPELGFPLINFDRVPNSRSRALIITRSSGCVSLHAVGC